MANEHPGSAGNAAVALERRNGPADRRSGARGGRRSIDVVATGLMLSAIFVAGCAKNDRLSPLAPSSVSSDVRSEISEPASPRVFVGAGVVPNDEPDGGDIEVDAESGGDDTGDLEVTGEGEIEGVGDEDVEFGDLDIATAAASSSLTISPRTATVAPGQRRQFRAKGAKGTVRWKATGGTISRKGLFKAGTKTGTFAVTASTTRQGRKTAKVTVRRTKAPPTPPPPPAGDGGGKGGDGGGGTGPVDGTTINPGESIQSAVNANPEGTRFVIKAGVHRRQSVKPKDGMTFVGEPGAVLDGEGATPRAFHGQLVRRVTIRGLRITGYVPPNTMAAVDGIDSTGWIVEDNEIDHNSNDSQRAYGLRLGDDMVVRGNRIHHNGWVGIAGYEADNVLIERNELYANPPAAFNDTLGEAANIKLFQCGHVTFRNNSVHDGPMIGVWFDTMKPDNTIAGNRVVNHGGAGIWYEVSYRGTISGNYVDNAGHTDSYSHDWLRSGGIQVTNSPDVSVLNNTVTNSLNGIIAHQAAGYPGGRELRNLLVQGNTVIMPRGQTGVARNVSGDAVYESWNNRFAGNRYQLGSNARPFFWNGRGMTGAEWKSGPGSADTVTH